MSTQVGDAPSLLVQVYRVVSPQPPLSVAHSSMSVQVAAAPSLFVHVMYMGKIVESGPVGQIFENPLHPYTQALLGSIPRLTGPLSERLTVVKGSVPGPYTRVPGCVFHPRCEKAISGVCDAGVPPSLEQIEPGHQTACHLYDQREVEAQK